MPLHSADRRRAPERFTAPLMGGRRALLVCGWNPGAELAAESLRAAGVEPVAIGDRSAAALVAARAATALPCSRYVPQLLDAEAYDLVLLTDADHLSEDAARAARRGAGLVVLADLTGPDALRAVARVAEERDVPLFLLRPTLQDPGVAELLARVGPDTPSRPLILDVAVEGDADVTCLAGIAASIVARLTDGPLAGASARTYQGARMVAATVLAGGCAVALRARQTPNAFVRIAGEGEDGAFDLRIEQGQGRLVVTPAVGLPFTRVRVAVDAWRAEGQRIAAGIADAPDVARAEAELLEAILADGEDASYQRDGQRPALTVLRGGGRVSDVRTGSLHLVSLP